MPWRWCWGCWFWWPRGCCGRPDFKVRVRRSKIKVGMISQQLLLTIFLPLIGAIGLWLSAGAGRYVARTVALAVSLATLFCAGQLVVGFVRTSGGAEFAVTDAVW